MTYQVVVGSGDTFRVVESFGIFQADKLDATEAAVRIANHFLGTDYRVVGINTP